jgi:hypothetical protein
MNRLLVTSAVALVFGCVGLSATSAFAAHDYFNRASLGKTWVVPSGDGSLFITNNQLQGSSLSLGYDTRSAQDTKASALLYLNGTDLEYGAVAVGDIAGGNNIFVKLQSQNADGVFEYGGFYVGNNSGVDFFQLDSTVPSPAKLSVSLCGSVAVMRIDSAAGVQRYSFDYGTTFGTGGGLGTYGNISLDNYKSGAANCADAIGATVIKGSSARDLSLSK